MASLDYITGCLFFAVSPGFWREVTKPAPNDGRCPPMPKSVNHFITMFRLPGKSDGQTGTKILLEAISKDKVHLARFVLDALDGEIVDSKTEGAQTPLISSTLLPDGQTRCKFMELLLQRGARVNRQDGNGRTALSYACEKGYLDAAKVLVRNNADPEIMDTWGNTSLMYAAVGGHSPIVEFLVRAFKRLGLQIDRQNKVGNSAAEVAKFLGHTECFSALTNNAKRGRETEGSAQGNAQPRVSVARAAEKLGPSVKRLEVLQTRPRGDDPLAQDGSWQSRRTKSRMPSMDSIEEFERENDSLLSSPQELVFSRVLTPKPPPRTTDHSPACSLSKAGAKLSTTDDLLPPLTQGSVPLKSVFFSPRPSRNTPKPCASTALGILLTPIVANKAASEKEKPKTTDFGVLRFHDSYYQKRCSLPTSILSPTPPDRTLLVPLRKSKTLTRRATSSTKVETLDLTAPAAATAATTFQVLRSTLFRRFTSPEIKKHVRESEEDPALTPGRIPRSESYPLGAKHPQVGSKPSIDSISSVKCEFDFHFRVPPP